MDNTAIKVAATPQSVKWGFFDSSTPAITSVASGSEVVIDTVSGEPPHLPVDGAFEILPEHRPILEQAERGPGPHLLTGPIHVEGAKPGDVLAVDILDVSLRQNWGFT
jgi:acetamidase/formamidase